MRSKSLCVLCISIFVILSICPITCFAYSNQYPGYLGYGNSAYIEIDSNLGRGSIIIPLNYQYDYLTMYNGNQISNVGTNTISGYFITASGNSYDIRIQSLGVCQYRYTNGYQTTYYDLTFTDILNTNCNIKNFDSASENLAYKFSIGEICIVVLLCFLCFIEFFKLVYSKVRYARTF